MSATEARFYYRISEDKTGERLGVERQEPSSVELCGRLGFTPGEAYIDNDLSATTGVQRPEFERLLADLQSDPGPVIVWHTDRLLRLTSDLERVIETGVNVHAVHAGHFDLSTPAGRAVARTVTAWAQYEGEQKALRQKEANLQRAQMGRLWWPTRPFGFERDGTLREDEAQAIRLAYDDLLAGVSITAIANGLNERGLLSPKGKAWGQPSMRQILLNARNAGIRVYNGEEVETKLEGGKASWSAIVPVETYRAAVKFMSDPSRRTGGGGKRVYMLTGILKCGVCKGDSRVLWVGVQRREAEDPKRNYPVYTCRRGHCFTAPVAALDSYVAGRAMRALDTPEGAAAWSGGKAADTAELKLELQGLNNRLDEFQEERAAGELTGAEYRALTGKVKGRKAEIENELAKAGLARVIGEGRMSSHEVAAHFETLGLDRQRTVLGIFLRRLEALPRGKGVKGVDAEHVVMETIADPDEDDRQLRIVS